MIDNLVPRPRQLRIDDAGVRALPQRLAETAITGLGPDSEAWRLLGDERPEEVGDEGYVLRISGDGEHGGRAILAARTETGLFRGRARLRQLADTGDAVPALTIRDWPYLARRGVIEGFYGAPWSHEDRLGFLRFAGRVGLNEYVYAPKDDPYHRERWREPYPDGELRQIAQLAEEAAAQHVHFVYTIAPALSMRFSDDAEHELLAAKARQLWRAGIRSFALLFDDVPGELIHTEDIQAFGSDTRAAGRAHGLTCARFRDGFLLPQGVTEPLAMCPMEYAGGAPSPYRDGLDETLPADALVMWTGSDIVVGEVTRDDIDAAASSFRRRLMLWDNFPVNDFDRSRLFLGPLRGRTTWLDGSALAGICSNPMVEAMPSRFALASVADWAWNPQAYDAEESAARALAVVAGRDAGAVAPLVSACSSWPPSAPQSPRLEALVDRALADDADALTALEAALAALETVGVTRTDGALRGDAGPGAALHRALRPWYLAARDAGRAGVMACVLLRHLSQGPAAALIEEREAVGAALLAAERHFPNVLRSILPRFVRAVLVRAGLEDAAPQIRRRVTVVAGANPIPGDRDLAERLTARRFDVTLTHEWNASSGADADLVIVTPGASADSARALAREPIPVLAWGRLETLGLGSDSGVLLSKEEIEVDGSADALAAGLNGRVRVYRGPGKLTWCEPSPDGVVIARSLDGRRPVIAHYGAGAELPNGDKAPASRVTFCLGGDGLAPWLMAPAGYALFNAAVDLLASREDGQRAGAAGALASACQ